MGRAVVNLAISAGRRQLLRVLVEPGAIVTKPVFGM